MKCAVCKKQVKETFLKKLVGTHVKDRKGKLSAVCFECQKRHKTKEELLAALE
ncbi:hypothetical protein HYU15_00980 [Candidatus Woesearchaeota archaeon]|nr:hypothetical protein [Candidatus Woesearchaeota archaeon]